MKSNLATPSDGYILSTERLRLRCLTDGDSVNLRSILGDPENMRFYPAPYDDARIRGFIGSMQASQSERGFSLWAVEEKQSGAFVGDCGLIFQKLEYGEDVEVGYHLHRDYQKRGYATEAARACIRYAFRNLNFARVISLIRPENKPSRGVAERNGMQVERRVFYNGFPHDVFVATHDNY